MIVDDDAAIAVENAAARRQQGTGANAILLRFFGVVVGVLNLQPPEAGDEEYEHHHRGILEDGDPAAGELGVVMQPQRLTQQRLGISLGRRNDHDGNGNLRLNAYFR